MEFGVCLPQYGRDVSLDGLRAVSEDAESLGFHSVWVSDHVVTPAHLQASMGPVFFDAFVVLSLACALTSRVKLGTTVMVTPYRNPLVAAKMIASLDVLSAGRVILGIGSGGAPDEFAALGVPESHRGRITDEYLAAMVELWTKDPSSFDGRFVNFEDVRFGPKPVQQPHPPLWVGGRSDAALRRAARVGQAWHPTSMPLEVLKDRMGRLAEFSVEAGRYEPPQTTIHQGVAFEEHRGGSPERRIGRGSSGQVAEDMSRYAELGVPTVVCNFRTGDTDGLRRAMETFAVEVTPQLN